MLFSFSPSFFCYSYLICNKYTFVWKKAVTKNQAKLLIKLADFVAECEQLYDIVSIHYYNRYMLLMYSITGSRYNLCHLLTTAHNWNTWLLHIFNDISTMLTNIIFHINYKSELYVLKFTRIPIYSYDIM